MTNTEHFLNEANNWIGEEVKEIDNDSAEN